jgi:hypothetical protein
MAFISLEERWANEKGKGRDKPPTAVSTGHFAAYSAAEFSSPIPFILGQGANSSRRRRTR